MFAQSVVGASKLEPDRRFCTNDAYGPRMPRGTGSRALAELEELHQRILFSILVSQTDDYLRNPGLLYDRSDDWTLSPAFDLSNSPRHPHLNAGISERSGWESSVEAGSRPRLSSSC